MTPTAKVVIVGGGVIGSSTAYSLKSLGGDKVDVKVTSGKKA